ncbi:MAG: hypothetical protein OEW77_09485, partial [Gemmatimonadota bacterium]|nr:hypothetical protein [Gemmatimonadota bacterium]
MRLPRTVLLALAALLAATATHAQIAFRAASQAGVAAATSPTYVGVGTVAAVNANNCPSITPSVPAGSVGDLLIAAVSSGDNVAINMAGWNTLFAHAPVGNYQAKLFWRIAQATNASTITRGAASGCNVLLGRISRFTGVDPVEPIQGIFAPGTLPGGTQPACRIPGGGNWCYQNLGTVTTGTQTTIDADALLVMTAHTSDNSNITGGLPAGFTFQWENVTTFGNDASIALFTSPQTATGTFGPYTMNKNRGSDPNHGVLFALRSVGLRIPVPAGTALNDVMIATIAARPCSATSGAACTTSVTAPAGWTLVNSTSQTGGGGTGGFGNVLVTYRRVATAVDAVPGTTYKWTFGGSPVNAGAVGAITSYSGVDTTNPVVVDAGQATPTGFTHTAPSIDTGTVASTMLVSSHTANSSATWTSPPGMTEAADRASLATPNDLGLSLEVNYELRATAGATGTRTATHANPPASDTGAAHMLALRPAVTVAHYAISLLSSTVATCALAEVTITAHNTLHAASAPPGTRTVTLSTSTGTGVWQPALVAGAGVWTPSGLNNGLATYRWSGGETNFTVRLAQSVAATLSINLSDGFVVEDPTEDPPLTFAASALRVSNGANVPLAIGNQIALKPSNTGVGSQALFLQAVQTSGGACTGMFPVGSEIDFEVGAQCNSPAACSRNVTLTTTATSGSPTGVFVPNGAFPAVIRFRITTANAEAPFFFNYADAGQITLQFRRALPAPPAGAFVTGTSNPFVTRPFGLAFRGASAATPVQHGTLPTSVPLAAAGDNFAMTLAAYAWASAEDDGTGNPLPGANITDNGLTPNFAASTTVSATGNLPGVATGAMSRGVGCAGAATIAAGSWSGGAATVADWCYSEVGNVFLGASATNYFGIAAFNVSGNSGLDGTGAAGGYVGRFRPKWFELTGTPAFTPRFDAACAPTSTFAY